MCKVRVDAEDVEVEAGLEETILEALRRCGYAYRWGCRRGGCGVCKVDLLQGEVDYRRNVSELVLSATERDGGVALSCRARPRGDVTIRLRDERLKKCYGILAT